MRVLVAFRDRTQCQLRIISGDTHMDISGRTKIGHIDYYSVGTLGNIPDWWKSATNYTTDLYNVHTTPHQSFLTIDVCGRVARIRLPLTLANRMLAHIQFAWYFTQGGVAK